MAVSDEAYFVPMTFDADLEVNVIALIDVMEGRAIPPAGAWDDIKEQVADCLKQFVELRRGRAG